MTITVTLVRHGESEDNLKSIWAGWKDAPLSALGRKQAEAVAKYFSQTPVNVVYTSPLLRAYSTGEAIHNYHPETSFISNPNLREQHFGIAEGHQWTYESQPGIPLEELYAQKIFPVLYGLDERFPEGESLADLALRAQTAISECIAPHLTEENLQKDEFHIVITSHGLCISELVPALLSLDSSVENEVSYKGLLNTAWTRVVIESKSESSRTNPNDKFKIRVTDVNICEHLKGLEIDEVEKPQNTPEDLETAQKKAFFGGSTL